MPGEKRNPYMKWYARDWRGDGALRGCSFAARGLWADLLTIIHDEGEPYGHLKINGANPDSAKLGRMLGGTAREIERLLAELEGAGVFSRADDGAIISRRMVRDKIKADTDKANGKGGGNPKLTGQDNGGVNPQDKAHTQNPTPEPIPKKTNFFVVGGGLGKGGVEMTTENKLALFQKWLAEKIGPHGWQIVGVAADPESPNYAQAIALCKKTARENGKGWPHAWPAKSTA